MAEKKKKCVTHLELSIRRELECQRKVFLLELQPNDNFQENLEPLMSGEMSLCAHKTNSASPTTINNVRSNPTCEPNQPSWSGETSQTRLCTPHASSDLPTRINNVKRKLTYEPSQPSRSCETSQTNLSTPHTDLDLSTRATNMRSKPLYEPSRPSWVQSPSRSSSPKPRSFPSPRLSGVKSSQTDDRFCKVCHVPCSSASNYMQHLNGQKHKAKVQELKLRGTGVNGDCEVTREQRRCEVCNIWCIDKSSFNMHLDGKKHKAMLGSARNGGGETAKLKKWCKLCDIWCQDEAAFEMHLEGKKHLVRFHDTEKERCHEGRSGTA